MLPIVAGDAAAEAVHFVWPLPQDTAVCWHSNVRATHERDTLFLLKGADALERATQETVILDKTGTLEKGMPSVTDTRLIVKGRSTQCVDSLFAS